MAMTFQHISTMYSFSVAGCALVLAIGFYLFSFAMTKTTKVSLLSINRKARDKSKRPQILKQIIEFLKFHSRVKQLSTEIRML